MEKAPKEETYLKGNKTLEEKFAEEKYIFIQVQILRRKQYKCAETGALFATENCE